MIIIKVQGGLGNQLLQYSFGRVLTLRYGKEVKYDLSFFENETKYTKRPYLLNLFTVLVPVATKEEIEKVRYPHGTVSRGSSFVYRVLNKYLFKKYYIGYDKDLIPALQKKDNCYLEGFWQSYLYYKESTPELSKEIALKDQDKLEIFKRESGFNEKESVSVHVRRGDLLAVGGGLSTLDRGYYTLASEYFSCHLESCSYYVFSDDSEWVKEKLGDLFVGAVYVSDCHLSDWEEFILMKDCKHAIIANSTFSWFAALLSDSNTKLVCYPKDWKNIYLNNEKNLCPKEWVGL